jgi:hypothetical protein
LMRNQKYQRLKSKYHRQIKHKVRVWALTGPVSELATENYQNGDLDPVRGQEFCILQSSVLEDYHARGDYIT